MQETWLKGVIPILQMPFDEAEGVDHGGLAAETQWLIAQGISAVGFGYGSEIRRLTEAELDAAVATVVRSASGKAKVVASLASGSVAAMISRARTLGELGADALLAPAPHQAQESAGIPDAFRRLSEATPVPLILQDAPLQTGVSLSVDVISTIARVSSVAALKLEAPPTVPKIEAIIGSLDRKIPVFGGAGGQDLLYELFSGVTGTMPGAGMPEAFTGVIEAYDAGRVDDAARIFQRYLPVISLARRSSDTHAFVHKELLRRRGVIASSRLRSPASKLPASLLRDLGLAIGIAGIETTVK